MLEGNEIAQQDANTSEESSAPQDSNQATEQETKVSADSGQAQTSQEQVPFHEHPRFKELIEERKTYAQQAQEMQRAYQELQKQIQSLQKPKEDNTHPFVAKLKEIDPAYAEWASNLEQKAAGFEEFKAWRAEQEKNALVSNYESAVEKLHGEMNVPKELRDTYKDLLDAQAMKDPNFGLKNVAEAYKKIHERFSSYIESTKRAERASYVKDKSKDSSAPTSQPKGRPAGQQKSSTPLDRETILANIVKSSLSKAKAESDL